MEAHSITKFENGIETQTIRLDIVGKKLKKGDESIISLENDTNTYIKTFHVFLDSTSNSIGFQIADCIRPDMIECAIQC